MSAKKYKRELEHWDKDEVFNILSHADNMKMNTELAKTYERSIDAIKRLREIYINRITRYVSPYLMEIFNYVDSMKTKTDERKDEIMTNRKRRNTDRAGKRMIYQDVEFILDQVKNKMKTKDIASLIGRSKASVDSVIDAYHKMKKGGPIWKYHEYMGSLVTRYINSNENEERAEETHIIEPIITDNPKSEPISVGEGFISCIDDAVTGAGFIEKILNDVKNQALEVFNEVSTSAYREGYEAGKRDGEKEAKEKLQTILSSMS